MWFDEHENFHILYVTFVILSRFVRAVRLANPKSITALQHVYTTVHDYRIEVRPLFLHCPFPLHPHPFAGGIGSAAPGTRGARMAGRGATPRFVTSDCLCAEWPAGSEMGLDSCRMSSRSIARWSLRTGLRERPSSTAILLASPCLRLLILGIIGLCGQVCDARAAAPGVPGRAADHPRRRDLRGELAAGGAELRLLCAPNNRPVCSGLACHGGRVSWRPACGD